MNFQAISNSSLLQITLHWAFLQLREKYQQSQICRLLLLFFSCYNVSSSLQPHELQHPRLPCPSLSPRVCSNSCPLSQWCYLNISSSATHFFFAFHLSQHQGLFQGAEESALCIRWPKCWSFSFSISPFNEYLELISFRIDWFDLLAVQAPWGQEILFHSLVYS